MFCCRHDSDQDGVVTVKEVSLICRTIGFNPPEAELQAPHPAYWKEQTFL